MVGVRQFNLNAKKPIEPIYGCVTNGDVWQFLRLRGTQLDLDPTTERLQPLRLHRLEEVGRRLDHHIHGIEAVRLAVDDDLVVRFEIVYREEGPFDQLRKMS